MSSEERGRRTLRYLGGGGSGLGIVHHHPHRFYSTSSLDCEIPLGGGRESKAGRRVGQGGGTKKRTTGSYRGRRESYVDRRVG